jgi:drug/metabolite transporter (DMT)-like permease
MSEYLLLLLGAFMCSIQFVFQKKYQRASGESARSAMLFTMLSGIAGAVYILLLKGFKLEFSVFSMLMAALTALDVMLINIVGIKTMRMGSLSVYTLFMMLGGMIVPFIMGVFVLNERPSVFCVLATLLVVLSLYLPVLEKKSDGRAQKGARKFYILCVSLFLLNGAYSCLSKLHQINSAAVSAQDFLFMIFAAEILFSGAALAVQSAFKKSEPVKLGAKSLAYCLGFALFYGTGAILIISGASVVNATVLYPTVTGGAIIFSALNGRVIFGEKLNKFVVSEVLIAVAATILFMF